MIKLHDVTLARGQHILLQHVDWTIFPQQKIGIIGRNGSGKSSLFALLLGEIQVDDGKLDISPNVKIAYVAQETPASDQTALDYVLDGDQELRRFEKKLLEAETNQDGLRIAHLHEQLSLIDAYTAKARVSQILVGLGFETHEILMRVKDFSGGWRMRLNLAKALIMPSNVLLLDEPTNHLDLDAVLWLEQWIKQYKGTLLLISHDRDFLDETIDHIAHFHQKKIKCYTGDYSFFEKQRAADLLAQQANYEKQQKQLAHIQSFIARFRAKATKARQVQSRIKAVERMELVSAIQTESAFQFQFREPKECPNPLIKLDHAAISFGEKCILNKINLSISPKDRIAMVGPNGAGKSSLIKLLANELTPSSGLREASPGTKIGYFAQHQVDHLKLQETPFSHLQALQSNETELELRKFLGSFGFSNDRIFEPVENFSGGEKARLALALLVFQKPNLLLLDEPTNHLDLDMRQALSLALQEYEGALLLVTHDRFLVRTTTDQLILVANQELQNFDGDFNDYQQWLLEYRKQQSKREELAKPSPSSRKEQRKLDAMQRDLLRPLVVKIQAIEKSLNKLQREAQAIEIILAGSELYEARQKEKLRDTLLTQAKIKKEIDRLELEWLQACEERDNIAEGPSS